MILYENMLPEEVANKIEETLLGTFFAWYYTPFTAYGQQFKTSLTQDTPQFTHGFYAGGIVNSYYHDQFVLPIIELLPKEYSMDNLIRAKANLINRNQGYPENFHNVPHADQADKDTTSLIYYVNESDGDTLFFEEMPEDFKGTVTIGQRFSPKRNSGVMFNSRRLHTSVPPRKTNARVVINLVFENKGV